MDLNFQNNSELQTLQNELKKILIEFRDKCEEKGLRYYLFYGTMLGAVRHKGFIPWDDDVDVLMPREDLDRFVRLFGETYSDTCYLDGYNCSRYESYAPNVRINSRRVFLVSEQNGARRRMNAFISIWIIDGLPQKEWIRKWHLKRIFFHYKILRLSRAAVQGAKEQIKRSRAEKLFLRLNRLVPVGKLIPPKKAAASFNKLLRKYPFDYSEKCFIGWSPRGKRIFERAWFEGGVSAEFCGEQFQIPIGWEGLLNWIYKTPMELPPEDKRRPSHSIEIEIVDDN